MDENEFKDRTKQFVLRVIKCDALIAEGNEILAMIVASIKTLRARK